MSHYDNDYNITDGIDDGDYQKEDIAWKKKERQEPFCLLTELMSSPTEREEELRALESIGFDESQMQDTVCEGESPCLGDALKNVRMYVSSGTNVPAYRYKNIARPDDHPRRHHSLPTRASTGILASHAKPVPDTQHRFTPGSSSVDLADIQRERKRRRTSEVPPIFDRIEMQRIQDEEDAPMDIE